MDTGKLNLIGIRQRLKLRREDLTYYTQLCYHTICRCEAENKWPVMFSRRLAYQEALRDLLMKAGESAESIKKLGIPDLLQVLHEEVNRISKAELPRVRKRTAVSPAPPPPSMVPGRGAGFFAR